MKSLVRPELPTASAGSSQAPIAAVVKLLFNRRNLCFKDSGFC